MKMMIPYSIRLQGEDAGHPIWGFFLAFVSVGLGGLMLGPVVGLFAMMVYLPPFWNGFAVPLMGIGAYDDPGPEPVGTSDKDEFDRWLWQNQMRDYEARKARERQMIEQYEADAHDDDERRRRRQREIEDEEDGL